MYHGHMACVDWWSYLYDPWVSRCFSVFWALFFKLTVPFISPFTFSNFFNYCSESLLLHFSLVTIPILFRWHPLHFFSDGAVPFQGVFLFSSYFISFFFIICYKFLDFSFPFPLLWLFLFSGFWDFSFYLFLLCFFWVSMVSSSEVRIACPSVSFIFTHLGGSLGVFPNLEDFDF